MSNSLNLKQLKYAYAGISESTVKHYKKAELLDFLGEILADIANTTEESTNSTPVAQDTTTAKVNTNTSSIHPVQLVIKRAISANKAVESNNPSTNSLNQVVKLSQQLGYTLSITQKNYLKATNQATVNCIIATLSKHTK